MNFRKSLLASTLLVLFSQAAVTEDAYFHLPIAALTFAEGTLPGQPNPAGLRRWQTFPAFQPYAVLDGEGEVYIGGESLQPWDLGSRFYDNTTIAIRAAKGKDVSGRLFVPKPDFNGMLPLKFTVAAAKSKPESLTEFLKAKESHYRRLLGRNIPGAAWFRHQERETTKARGDKATDRPDNLNRLNRPRPFEAEDTYEMFSGGRAVSENLQLDRLLAPAQPGESMVALTNLAGISVHELDWKPLIKDLKPQTDPLAACVPFDQHAIFFPSFTAMTEMMDEADADGTPVLQLLEPRSEDANARGRYQKQLCLELSDLSRLLGPQVINGVAFTGSDPYLRTGTDIGVLFETKSPAVLQTFIAARQTAVKQANSAVKAVSGEIEGVHYTGVVSPDRSVCSYVAALDQIVIVSNSLYQLGCLVRAAKGKKASLATQDEYTFFRSRYARGDKDETAFLILTDATIRRWCGPQWRIANSRRTRVAAALAELQAAHFDELARGNVRPGRPLATDLSAGEAGEVQLASNGVLSSTYGTLDFLTPIAEIPLAKVTQAEADAYNRWRNGYQQNWRQYFDPIAVRFSVSARRLSAEITVMPLIAGTDYRQFIGLTSGSRIAPDSGDPHPETLLHLAMAVNAQSEAIKEAGNFLGSINTSLKANPLGWLGDSIALYADQDPFWEKLAQAEKAEEFMGKNFPQLPLALYCEVKNPLGLATFLAALRGFVEQTAPKMTVWQNSEYNGQAYVKVTSTPTGVEGALTNLAIFYAVTPRSLVLTLSEPLLKRALDRQSAREMAKGDGKPPAPHKPWLGTNLCLQVERQFLGALQALSRDSYESAQQLLSWNNLPILNEWKRLYPSQDPVKLHEQFWQTKLICPGGGAYVWNEKWQTMESTVFGHPGEPKAGPGTVLPLAKFTGANLGVTFEHQGLSARAVLDRETNKP